MPAKDAAKPTEEHNTTARVGQEPVDLTLADGQVVSIRRGAGKRFLVTITTEKPIRAKKTRKARSTTPRQS